MTHSPLKWYATYYLSNLLHTYQELPFLTNNI